MSNKEKREQIYDALEADTESFMSPFQYYVVRSIDPGVKILAAVNGPIVEYMAFDAELTIHEAVDRYRKMKDAKIKHFGTENAANRKKVN